MYSKLYHMRTLDLLVPKVDCRRGAPMGRADIGSYPLPFEKKRVYDCAVPMIDGAYDRGGAYWGLGAQLRVSYTKDLAYVRFYRK